MAADGGVISLRREDGRLILFTFNSDLLDGFRISEIRN
jgi:hypothetical protein